MGVTAARQRLPLGILERWRASLGRALIITRREMRDSLRDWRIVVPIVLLTLVFPWLMQFTANVALDFVSKRGATIIGLRIIPFLLMIVGFFPISFSLVIALETFVGEKERKSLEPLLATPLTNAELYWGKTLAAMLVPLLSSYLGLVVYLIGLYISLDYHPPLELLVQIVLLTTAEALVMVSGAVIVSSQATSVRAANLLASFIIIPMALLVQAESVIMFWARYRVLWWIVAGLLVVDLILVRTGIQIFNREELLGREIDQLDLRRAWQLFRQFLRQPPEAGHGEARSAETSEPPLTLRRLYLHDLPSLLRRHWLPLAVTTGVLVGGALLGAAYSMRYPLPPGVLNLEGLPEDVFKDLPNVGFLPRLSTKGIFLNNIRALTLAALLGLFSFGSLALVLLMVPLAIVGFLAGEAAIQGYNPLIFLTAFILPHGVVELPAAIIATAFALRLGASLISPPPGRTVGEGLLWALADFVKVFVLLVIPLLLVAAFLEAHLTPQVVLWLYGR